MENSVVVAKADVEELTTKSVVGLTPGIVELAAKMESMPYGELVPMPRKPVAVKVLVAVPPKYATCDENWVDEAFPNCWRAVQVLALPRLREKAPAPYERPVPAVVVATPTHVPPTRASTCPSVPAKSDEVARAEGMAEPLVLLARTEFPAMAAKVTLPAV
jgi:hypothetical protein